MKKDWYDKYGKEFHCADCTFLDSCLKKDEPLYSRCCEQYLRDRIAELEEQLKGCIRPKFNRQEHICGFAFGEIREYIVVAYLDNDITLCENTETSELEWCDNNFLVRNFEEAQTKLQQMKGNNYE